MRHGTTKKVHAPCSCRLELKDGAAGAAAAGRQRAGSRKESGKSNAGGDAPSAKFESAKPMDVATQVNESMLVD